MKKRYKIDDDFFLKTRERIQTIDEKDTCKYLWFFHKPFLKSVVASFLFSNLKKLLFLVLGLIIIWLINKASFTVAHYLCILYVFFLWPLLKLLDVIPRFLPPMLPEFKHMLKNYSEFSDIANVLVCFFFLMAVDGALFNKYFVLSSPPDEHIYSWLIFFIDGIIKVITLGLSSDLGLNISTIKPASVAGGVIKYMFHLLIAGSIIQAVKDNLQWHKGNEFFTGTSVEVSHECSNRKEIPGTFVSLIGKTEILEPIVFDVKSFAETHYASMGMVFSAINRDLEKPIFAKFGDKSLYGKEAIKVLGVCQVELGIIKTGQEYNHQNAIVVYHTKMIPTYKINAKLVLDKAVLEINIGNYTVTLNPLHIFRDIINEAGFSYILLLEVNDMRTVGIRHGKLEIK